MGSWHHDEERLTCFCAARRFVCWLPKVSGVTLCDDRETALAEQETREQHGTA